MKRIVTIQDLTCLGKCALTVALPVISAMGIEASVLPTALLSVHTAFPSFTFHNLAEDLPPVIDHWKKEGFSFDGIYTGYLGSSKQLEMVSSFVDDFKTEENFFFMDPILGDHGALYPGFTPGFAAQMAGLCRKAHVIVPNLTEACLLLQRPYPGDAYDEEYIRTLLKDLSGLGAPLVILTGVSFSPDLVGVMAYDAHKDAYYSYFNEKLPVSFPGTGDVFSSVCFGALTRGASLSDSLGLAVDFTLESIRKSMADPHRRWYSVNFEEAIPMLVQRVKAFP